ncbi:MAG: M1 family peptidase [Acidimicrobiia bacterium]|nr:M1 family peptidase [Acidimicrobiia bacterium]
MRGPVVLTRLRVVVTGILLLLAHAAAGQRLPDLVVPEHYTLWFAPDFTTDTFRGTDRIEARLTRPSAAVTLHALDITFSSVAITADGRTQAASVRLDEAQQTATLQVAEAMPAGPITIDITFSGVLNDKLRGFYLSTANGRKYAVTQMEPTDARRAFPCFDEPALKATFDISVTAPAGDTVISNGALLSDEPGPDPGTHTLRFARTPKMSTYLVAMLVGDFVCRAGTADGVDVRVCATPDKQGLTGFALEAALYELRFFNEYFGIPYPFGKLDIVGVPDFAAGAMENAGAITFRESRLLADPARASLGTRKTVASIVSHEIAHQWFGNLVTMRWWDDIWLNEGFATWLANKPLQQWRPDWDTHLDDAQDTDGALSTDSLQATRAIRASANTPADIGQVFDAIAYEKAAAVIRMVERFVGEEAFRGAVISYLRRHAYGNATGEDFWNEVAAVAGKPVADIMASFVTQIGAPVLEVATACTAAATTLTLRQSRFTSAPGAPTPAPQIWSIPVCVRSAHRADATCRVIAKPEETVSVPGCGAPVFVNPHSVGYYISEYAPDAARALARDPDLTLTTAERLRLLGDEWALVRAGRHDIGVYLDVAAALADDEAPEVIGDIAGRLAYAMAYVARPDDRERLRAWIRTTFGPALDAMEFPGPADDSDQRQTRRATLVRLLGVTAGVEAVQARARELALRYLSDPSAMAPGLVSTVLQVAALSGDAALYERFQGRLRELTSVPEEYYRFLGTLSSFRDQALAGRTLEYALSDEVRSQDTAQLIAGVMGSSSRDSAWTFVKQHWTRVSDKLGTFQGLPGVVGSVGSFCSTDAAHEVRRFFQDHPVPTAARTLSRALERIESCAALAERQAAPLSAWLADAR